MEKLKNYIKEKNITHKIITSYLSEQNKKEKKVNRTIISFVWAIFVK